MKTGWQDLTEYEYQESDKYRWCLRSGILKSLDEGVDEAYHRITNPSETTKDQHFYSAIHAYLLGQKDTIVILDYDNYRKNEAKAAYDSAVNYYPCQPIILRKQWPEIENIGQSVAAHPIAAGILGHPDIVFEQAGIFEVPGYPAKSTGIYGKIKPDIRIPSKKLIVDAKALANPSSFYIQAKKLKWDYQDLWYRFGAREIDDQTYKFAFLGYETTGRYRCNLFYFKDFAESDEAYQLTSDIIYRNIAKYADALASNNWAQDTSPISIQPIFRKEY